MDDSRLLPSREKLFCRFTTRHRCEDIPSFTQTLDEQTGLIRSPSEFSTWAVVVASPQVAALAQKFPKNLFVVSQHVWIFVCEFNEPLRIAHVPQLASHFLDGRSPVRAFSNIHFRQTEFDGPFNERRKRSPLLTRSEFGKVSEPGIESNTNRFASPLAQEMSFNGLIRDTWHGSISSEYPKIPYRVLNCTETQDTQTKASNVY